MNFVLVVNNYLAMYLSFKITGPFLIFFLFLLCRSATAQDNTPPDWGAFFHSLDIRAWQGHRFQVTAAVRTIQLDSSAGAEVWVLTPRVTDTLPYEGRQCIVVDGSRFINPQTYGSNDTAGHYIMANGIRLYYETYGVGQPLLLLHGNSESISSFAKQIPALSLDYKVIAVDTRGQGRSGDDGRLYTYDLFAADMNALLDSLHLDSVGILGWSDGGNTGLIMAIDYPAKVRRLAVMGAVIFIDHSVVGNWIFHLLHKEQRSLAGDTTYSANRSRLITLLLTEPRHNFADLRHILCPVLVMAGEKDVVKEGHTRGIASHIPHSQLVIFPGGTHEEPDTNPALFNKTVLDFLAARRPDL
ncbi:MAG TPA: alpha/beta hydrolase [Puia sp.]|jgi:pimeloyl-ACP methyl ester carboxylesterase|nr:alpha/beta hydrolase [Puia sp.]